MHTRNNTNNTKAMTPRVPARARTRRACCYLFVSLSLLVVVLVVKRVGVFVRLFTYTGYIRNEEHEEKPLLFFFFFFVLLFSSSFFVCVGKKGSTFSKDGQKNNAKPPYL